MFTMFIKKSHRHLEITILYFEKIKKNFTFFQIAKLSYIFRVDEAK